MKRLVVGLLVGITCLLGTRMVMAEDPADIGGPYLFHSAGDIPVVQAKYEGIGCGVALQAQTDSANDRSAGVIGCATAETGATYGVYGLSKSGDGIGVYGKASAETGATYGVSGLSNSSEGIGVYGKASAETGATYGVSGLSTSSEGIGVYGVQGSIDTSLYPWAPTGVFGISSSHDGVGVFGSNLAGIGVVGYSVASADGIKAGVTGFNLNPDGYAIFSFGNTRVEGDLTVGGSITVDGSIKSTNSTNLALNTEENSVTVWASSEHGPLMIYGKECTYWMSYINDGKSGYWDKYEWATDGEKNGNFKYFDPSTGLQGAKIELTWTKALEKMTRVVIDPRPNKYDKIEDCWLQVMQVEEDGKTVKAVNNIHLGQLNTPREIKLEDAEGANVIAVGVLITETTSDTYNIGLAEIECYVE